MALQKTIFRPGIYREGTDYDNEGGWFDCNLVPIPRYFVPPRDTQGCKALAVPK